ncbi:MAG: hypothetical protein JWR00_97 [Rubritepida sp.]|nr:hypothetical protein [Rubritepida sp.]
MARLREQMFDGRLRDRGQAILFNPPASKAMLDPMLLRLARLVIAAITICAFLGAGLVQNMLSAQGGTADEPMAMAMQADGAAAMPCHDAQAPPCKDKVPGCMTDLG